MIKINIKIKNNKHLKIESTRFLWDTRHAMDKQALISAAFSVAQAYAYYYYL
jgi:hypothetical protein